jgi:CRP/FNR family transcriptional regulator, cyclic AMP receptor protein
MRHHGAPHHFLLPRDALCCGRPDKPGGTRSGAMQRPRATIKRARPASILRPALDKLAPLRNHPVFREFPPAVVEHLGTYMTRRKVPEGTVIFAKGDPGTTLMAVLSGSVRISVSAGDGHEAVLNIIKSGQLFGEVALLDGRARTADAVAIGDCELIVIDRRDFIPFLQREPDIVLKLIEILCARIRRTSTQVEDVMYLSLPARLAKALLDLSGGVEASAARHKVRIAQRELGNIVGMSRESTNKQLRAWERREWVQLERGSIAVVDAEALMKLIH